MGWTFGFVTTNAFPPSNLEKTEYEPEQFPGLIYRPSNVPCVVLLFATGRVVNTGSSDKEGAEAAFENPNREDTAPLHHLIIQQKWSTPIACVPTTTTIPPIPLLIRIMKLGY